MNPVDPLETLLHRARLRAPSPEIRSALFAPRPAALETVPVVRPQAWFAPLAAAAVVLLSLATVWSPGGVAARSAFTLAAAPGALDPSLVEVQRNALPRPSFRSTTGASAPSSFGSLLLRQTNILAH